MSLRSLSCSSHCPFQKLQLWQAFAPHVLQWSRHPPMDSDGPRSWARQNEVHHLGQPSSVRTSVRILSPFYQDISINTWLTTDRTWILHSNCPSRHYSGFAAAWSFPDWLPPSPGDLIVPASTCITWHCQCGSSCDPSPLNIQASSGLLQLFPTIQLPPCSTKELKTHCQSHDKECLFAEFPPKNSSQLRSASLRKSVLFQKPKVWLLLELSNNKLKPWCRTGYLNLGCHSQISMGCDAKCKQTDSQ